MLREKYEFGRYAVLVTFVIVAGEKFSEPHNIVIYGPNKYKLSVGGDNAMAEAFKIADKANKGLDNSNDTKTISSTVT